MLKTLKFSGEESNFLFVSDLHHCHDRNFIYTKRKDIRGKQYESVVEHDRGILEAWNSVCTNRSIVFNCGDVVFNDPDGNRFLQLMRQLDFKEHFILFGNHTSGQRQIYLRELIKQFPNAMRGYELLHEVYPLKFNLDENPDKSIIFLPSYAEIQINSTKLVLCHYPIYSHNGLGKNYYHVCGHSHSGCDLTNKDKGRGFRLDVGVESFGRPISLKEVKHHLKDRGLDSVDHHNEKTK